jgi:hypothetical protein
VDQCGPIKNGTVDDFLHIDGHCGIIVNENIFRCHNLVNLILSSKTIFVLATRNETRLIFCITNLSIRSLVKLQ